MAARQQLKVAGMHLPFPGFGHVVKRERAYGYIPAQWHYEL